MSEANFTITKHVFPGQHLRQYPGATRHSEEDVLYLEAKQYTPLSNPTPQVGDVTIIATGSISFPKEMYEPLWDDFLIHSEHHGLRIRSIWSVDKSDHGASGILNEHTQGDDPSSSDLARDLLNMINIFRDQMTVPIVGIGHSMGATALLELSHIHPRLFASLVVIDPVVGPSVYRAGYVLVYTSSKRVDLWPSRGAAERFFRSSKPLQKWDSRVVSKWFQYGLRDTPTLLHPEPGKVTLRTTKANEAWSYARSWFDALPRSSTYRLERGKIKYPDGDESIFHTHPFYLAPAMSVWETLPHIQHSVLYIFPDNGTMSSPKTMAEKVAQTGTGPRGSGGEKARRADRVVIKDSGHLVAFEKPKMCAKALAEWLKKDLKAWDERRNFEAQNRDDKSINKVALSDEWLRQAKMWFDTHMGKTRAKL